MPRYHIKKDGTPGICRAKLGNCPLGGEGQHFSSQEDAQKHADEMLEKEHANPVPHFANMDSESIEEYENRPEEERDPRYTTIRDKAYNWGNLSQEEKDAMVNLIEEESHSTSYTDHEIVYGMAESGETEALGVLIEKGRYAVLSSHLEKMSYGSKEEAFFTKEQFEMLKEYMKNELDYTWVRSIETSLENGWYKD